MKLKEMFEKSQEEILLIVKDKLSLQSSAVWIAEGVTSTGLLQKSDLVLVFFEGTLMMIAERLIKNKNNKEIRAARLLSNNYTDSLEKDLKIKVNEEEGFIELVIFRKGWYEWLDT